MRAYPEFQLPKSYIVPEGVEEGETFEDIAVFKVKANGKLCLIKIGDSAIMEQSKSEPDDLGSEEGMSSRLTDAYKNR